MCIRSLKTLAFLTGSAIIMACGGGGSSSSTAIQSSQALSSASPALSSQAAASISSVSPSSQASSVSTLVSAAVTIDTATHFQTLEGFGASLAWYQSTLVAHSRAEEIYGIIFGDLGLDIIRLRNRYERSSEAVNLSHEQTLVNAATASLGHAPKLLMTSWSPPAPLKASGAEDCTNNSDCTLKKVDDAFVYDDFATYWRDSLEHYHSLGIVPSWISLQNEPGFIPGSWEGCKFTPIEGDYPGYGIALQTVADALQGLSNSPVLLGAESLSPHYNREISMQASLNQSLLGGLAHHLYESGSDGIWDWRDPGPDSYIAAMQSAVTAANGLPIFMTEFQTDDDNGTEGGFETAWMIHNSMAEANNVAWLYWDLVWARSSVENGMVSLGSNDYTITDQYYALRHYARFTDPGYVRIGSESNHSNLRTTAYLAPDNTRLTLVMVNVGNDVLQVGLDRGTFTATTVQAYRTQYDPGNSTTWETIAIDDLNSPTIVIPSKSQATIIFDL